VARNKQGGPDNRKGLSLKKDKHLTWKKKNPLRGEPGVQDSQPGQTSKKEKLMAYIAQGKSNSCHL